MSRVGRNPIPIPKGTKIKMEDRLFTAEGPKGTVSQEILPRIEVEIGDTEVLLKRVGESRDDRAKHGLMRALVANAVTGAHEGFSKVLEINGVGYRAEVQGKTLNLSLGFSHQIEFSIPEGIEIEVDKNNKLTVRGARKQQVGQVAAEIRALRKPEPYKGKGIKYADEVIRRKVGKAGVGSGG
ncbi:MAG: 50S ribosomal protein L6 [bacterium]|nr:50S ribosomal protein L6 [bacterium]